MKKGYTFHICRENSGKLWHLLLLKIYSEGKGKGGMEFFQGLSMQGCMYAFLHMAVSVHLSSSSPTDLQYPSSPCTSVYRAIGIFTSTDHKGKSGEDIRFFNPEATNYQSN